MDASLMPTSFALNARINPAMKRARRKPKRASVPRPVSAGPAG
ncbi:hypothetical protein [Thermococcus henrietii]|nr:hypothetical protein [Thermococcus henrietii]